MENCDCTHVKCGKFIITIAVRMAQITKEFCQPFRRYIIRSTHLSGKMLNESKRDFLNSDPHIFFFSGIPMYVFHATVVNNCISRDTKSLVLYNPGKLVDMKYRCQINGIFYMSFDAPKLEIIKCYGRVEGREMMHRLRGCCRA